MPLVALDTTPVDTMHRSRGIGRYAQGLIQGFGALEANGALAAADLEVVLLRQPHEGSLDVHPGGLAQHTLGRRFSKGIMRMWTENRLRMDRMLPQETDLYHATSMEGVSKQTPWVPTCHDLIPMLMPQDYFQDLRSKTRIPWWDAYVKAMKDEARRVVAISHHVKSTLVDVGIPEQKIDVVYHGLSDFWGGRDERLPPAHVRALRQEPYVLFIGGYDPRKNFEGLTLALSLIPESRRPRLVAVGGRKRAAQKETESLVAKHGIDATFLGYIDDVSLRFLYRHSRGLVFPSTEEGWGFPIVEAMAAGAPVVCAHYGSMVESAGDAAITCDVRGADELSHAIMHMVEDEAMRQRHIALGLKRVEELTWTHSANALLQVWERAL